jgi:hypothetical protein
VPTDQDARLGAAQQLVAAESNEVGAGRQSLLGSRFGRQAPAGKVDQGAAAQVDHERQAMLMGKPRQLLLRHGGGEADDGIVAGMHLEQQAGFGGNGRREVPQVGAVGGAHLHQATAGAGHDVGDAEGTADLDQLAAGNDDLLAPGQRVESQEYRRRIVVDHGCGFGSGQLAQQIFHVHIAVAAPAAVQVEFQVGGLGQHVHHRLHRLGRKQGTPQIGVQHRAGEIEHRAQGWLLAGFQKLGATRYRLLFAQQASGRAVSPSRPRFIQHGAHGFYRTRAAETGNHHLHGGQVENTVD